MNSSSITTVLRKLPESFQQSINVLIFCIILTSRRSGTTRAATVYRTWAKKCIKSKFIANLAKN